MQFARDWVSAALQKGEQALTQLQTAGTGAAPRPGGVGNSGSAEKTHSTSLASGGGAIPLDARVDRFRVELSASYINVHALKRLSMQGVPDKDGLRAVVWKVLLGYLPPSPSEWKAVLERQRKQYYVFCDELIVDPKRPMREDVDLHTTPAPSADPLLLAADSAASPGPNATTPQPVLEAGGADPLSPNGAAAASASVANGAPSAPPGAVPSPSVPLSTAEDHPLSLDAGSRWRTFFQDNETLEQITRDVMRTHPDMHFFTGETEEAELHRQELRRALFMYAKLNPGLRYIQGMNELIAPLYYLFKHDKDPEAAANAEADAFWCFLELISEFRDHFCAQLDNAQTGIRATIRRLMVLLRHCDRELWNHVEVVNKVDPQYYAFRWITLLLSQEFAFPDTLRIWDTVLSDPAGRMDCLLRICAAMVLHVKPQLMQADFATTMHMLQRYPPVDVNYLLRRAGTLPSVEEALTAS